MRCAQLPDPLAGVDGRRVREADEWNAWRRAELLDLFRANVYGREPKPDAVSLRATARTETAGAGGMRRRKVDLLLSGPVGTLTVPVEMYLPADGARTYPAMLLLNNRGPQIIGDGRRFHPFWPADHLVSRGYAAVVVDLCDIAPDADSGFTSGVHGIVAPEHGDGSTRPDDAWATIAGWAWGAGRVLDYLVGDRDVDESRVAVVGHSRGGKAALWAAALDERFAMAVSNDSGCTGAAVSRGNTGERIADINRVFPHWFATAYHCFADRADQLPVDQHELLALIAPRLLYVASAADDAWADPASELRALLGAQPVYRLFGQNPLFEGWSERENGLGRVDQPTHDRVIGHHRRSGGHDLTRHDWSCFLDFADSRL